MKNQVLSVDLLQTKTNGRDQRDHCFEPTIDAFAAAIHFVTPAFYERATSLSENYASQHDRGSRPEAALRLKTME
eukprot:6459753-Amphidinium_carterae.1